ncbi:TPA: hypothetical protein DCZ39_03275 [Patescibacteria group bacterium]|nr:hypothetical protein [Candidatus Gracilibacteria bacterium]
MLETACSKRTRLKQRELVMSSSMVKKGKVKKLEAIKKTGDPIKGYITGMFSTFGMRLPMYS